MLSLLSETTTRPFLHPIVASSYTVYQILQCTCKIPKHSTRDNQEAVVSTQQLLITNIRQTKNSTLQEIEIFCLLDQQYELVLHGSFKNRVRLE